MARSVTFISGHDESGALPADIPWQALTQPSHTVVAFMALSRLDEIALHLLAAGHNAETPVAIIARATLPGQAVLRTTLGGCTLAARRIDLPTPAIVVIGEVVSLADLLAVADNNTQSSHVARA